MKAEADVVVDTTDLNVHQLRDRIVELFGDDDADAGMQTTRRVVRLQARPARSTSTSCSTAGSCRTRTGSTSCARSPASTSRCATTCSTSREPRDFLDRLDDLLGLLLPAYVEEGKTYLTHRVRLHRRPPPVGRHRRGGRAACSGERGLRADASSTGTSTE